MNRIHCLVWNRSRNRLQSAPAPRNADGGNATTRTRIARKLLLLTSTAALQLASGITMATPLPDANFVTGATWTVTGAGEPAAIDSTNCTANSCPTLRDAINSAASGDTIVFASALDGQTITLTLFSNNLGCVTSGPTTCTTGTLSTEFGPSAFFITGGKTLTIDATQNGLIRGIVLSASNNSGCAAGACFRLFDVDSGSGLNLLGLSLKGGLALGGSSYYGGGALGAGGAIFNQGSLTLARCTLSGNTAQGASTAYTNPSAQTAGGVGGDGDNTANAAGPNGGTYNANGIGYFGGFGGGGGGGGFGNYAGGNGGFGGGGGFSYSSDSSFHGGSGGFGGGGGGSNFGGPAGFGGGISTSNFGAAGAGMGGAIFNDAGTVSLINSTLSANAALGGAGYDSGNGDGYGGAIFNYMGNLTLNFVTLDDNMVVGGNGYPGPPYTTPGIADGGAIYSLGDNTALCQSGGNVCATTSAALTMNNSIAANSSGSSSDIVVAAINGGSSTSGGAGNLVMSQNGFGGTVVSTANPQLNALIGGGGIWNVMAPKAGSPAIDAAVCDGTATDQRGVARPSSGTQCDIGSVQYNGDVIFVDGFGN